MNTRSGKVEIRAINLADKPAWLALRRRLLPASSDAELESEWAQMMEQRGLRMTLMCVDAEDTLLGMIELSRRSNAHGLGPGPVAFVDTLHVEPGEHRDEAARCLADAAAKWAQARGCRLLASDTSLDNQWEQKLHLDLGFEEVARKVIYRRPLAVPPTVRAVPDSELPPGRPLPVARADSTGPREIGNTDLGSGWWPGPVRASIFLLGALCFYFTDIFSGNVFFGVVLPVVDVVFVIYLMILFVDMKYRRKTGAGENRIELYQGSNDAE